MSAENRATTRRAVVAGLVVAPVAALPAFPGLPAQAAADPIFSASSEFARAKAAEDLAGNAYNDLEESTWSALKSAGIRPTQIFTHRNLETHRELGLLSDSEYAAALAALDGPESEHQAMRRAVEELRESSRDAALARGEAEREFVTTAPTTRAGALRLLRHLAEFLDGDDVINDRFLDDVVGDAIRNAIAVFEREALA
ncbi:hypothetical protein [Methylocystis sp. SB2]|uniref:hypothetical protein n=1 Tax=Methylocystis sp. (strain SB2) TaxID=743836 RepID=UPI0004038E25|nr:hypothetical protein [Methylocystis sp. SB2]ULO22986.1 hypothetical protein LNB28_12545 [Methylocystis sp. SB2]